MKSVISTPEGTRSDDYWQGFGDADDLWLEAVKPLVNETLVFLHAYARGELKQRHADALHTKLAPFTENEDE